MDETCPLCTGGRGGGGITWIRCSFGCRESMQSITKSYSPCTHLAPAHRQHCRGGAKPKGRVQAMVAGYARRTAQSRAPRFRGKGGKDASRAVRRHRTASSIGTHSWHSRKRCTCARARGGHEACTRGSRSVHEPCTKLLLAQPHACHAKGVQARMSGRAGRSPPPSPPLSRTNRTRRVPHPVLIGHAASLSQVPRVRVVPPRRAGHGADRRAL